jgi:hypothetical protein
MPFGQEPPNYDAVWTTPPPIAVFLKRMISHPLSPYCPRGSLPLEPSQADPQAAGTPIGYACRPCGTHIRWTPTNVLKQMPREVRHHLIMRHG